MMKRLLCLFIAITLFSGVVSAQASWETFGQNRVQYRTFHWKYFDSTHFRVFYYDYGKDNAVYMLNQAEVELSHILYLMGGKLNRKLNIILYNSFGDYRQTNLGRKNDELNQANGGKVDVAGDNIPVFFDGDHRHLLVQVKRGIARVIKDNMLFGDNLKDVVKNAVKMNLPEWYTTGYVQFIAGEWTSNLQISMCDLVSEQKRKMSDLALDDPLLFGHGFWHFFAETYGDNAISNMLYLTRYRKTVNQALEMVCRKNAGDVFTECRAFFKPLIADSLKNADSVAFRRRYASLPVKEGVQYGPFAVSPSGRELAYVEKKEGQYKIYIRDVKYNKNYVIIDGGVKGMEELADPDYPMICWSPNGNKLAALYQQKGALQLRIFTTGKRIMEKRRIPARRIDRITGMCFMDDENTLAVTGIRKGQSDLYSLTIRNNRFTPITNDRFDDQSPVYVENATMKGILFLSNRSNPYLSQSREEPAAESYNVYLYSPTRGTNLLQLSHNKNQQLRDPCQWGDQNFSYLIEEAGKMKRIIVKPVQDKLNPDSLQTTVESEESIPLLSQHYIHRKGSMAEISRFGKQYHIFNTLIAELEKRSNSGSPSKDTSTQISSPERTSAPVEYITRFSTEDSSIFLNQIFNSQLPSSSRYQTIVENPIKPKAKIYRSNFYPDYIQTTLDNTLLFTRYQPIGNSFSNVPVSGFLTSTLTDIMEDYKLTGGARLGVDFRSLDYFLRFANYRRRLDWGLLFYHTKTTEQTLAPAPFTSPFLVLGRQSLDYLQANISYPMDMIRSIRFQSGVRYDRTRYLAQDSYSIVIPDTKQYWYVGRAEYVYDNTINPLLNIWKGGRAKIFAEYQYRFDQHQKGFFNIGYDARHYKTLYKNCILASRMAGASSTGKARILYFLGGVDNPLNAKSDQYTVIQPNENYAFQSLATNLRGYKQGARNGSGYMVWNEEIRLPIWNTFSRRQVKSGFIHHAQLIAFTDAGIAFHGFYPTADNIINQIRIRDDQSNVSVLLERSWALGYGLGLRTRILGYFLRGDFAWRPGGGSKPMLHLSMATDF